MERWAANWARRRQGEDSHTVALARRRIYILPTRFGAVFGVMVFAMLLGSLNYGASLGFALTFLLAGLGLVVMHHCHNNLLGAEIKFLGAAPVFAGDRAEFRLAVCNAGTAPRYEIELVQRGHRAGPVDVAAGATEVLRLGIDTERRGWTTLERFTVETRHPGRLLRAWTWIHMDARCLVYPQPAAPGRPLPDGAGYGTTGRPSSGDEDFAGLRAAAFQSGMTLDDTPDAPRGNARPLLPARLAELEPCFCWNASTRETMAACCPVFCRRTALLARPGNGRVCVQ